ncbi:MAG: tripartite tricarboxylate transporter TctB family protein [Burkholderiales bacterium]|nr:tripartite tricarboxylate transporter TctB family protein [Burkholderiales bacterium]
MAQDTPSEGASRPVVSTKRIEAGVAIILLIVGIVVVVESYKLGSGWTTDGPGSGYFPFYIGLIIVIASLGMLFQAVTSKSDDAFVDAEQLQRVLSVLLPATGYVLATVFLGLYIASAVYIALFMVILGKYPWLKSVLISVIVNVVFYIMFEVWFKVPLYKGTLDPLRFLGH